MASRYTPGSVPAVGLNPLMGTVVDVQVPLERLSNKPC
jgi:hypothetical protein